MSYHNGGPSDQGKFALLAMLISGSAFAYYTAAAAVSLARASFLDQIVERLH
jgi:hypothetical protein